MRILVTGGGGHVGSRLVSGLRDQHVDTGLTSRQDLRSEDWVHGVRLHRTSDIELGDWHTLLEGYTHVIHLVSPNESDCLQDPAGAERVVVRGSRRLGVAAARRGVKVIYFSTTQVYGGRLSGTITEDTACNPVSPYAFVHLQAEDVLRHICGENLTVVRLANSVGLPSNPKCNSWHLIVHDVARQAALEGSISLRSAGLQHRSFVAMVDVIRAVSFLLSQKKEALVVNISNVSSMSVRSMARIVRDEYLQLTGKGLEMRIPEPSVDDSENPFSLSPAVLDSRGFNFNHERALRTEISSIFFHLLRNG